MKQHRVRNRFILSFFVLGVIVPVAIVTIGSVLVRANSGEGAEGVTSTGQWVLLWTIWPTWILMLDAERSAEIAFIFMLTISAALNGVWYAGVCFFIWRAVAGLKSVARSIASATAK
jgi:hypothetical protein